MLLFLLACVDPPKVPPAYVPVEDSGDTPVDSVPDTSPDTHGGDTHDTDTGEPDDTSEPIVWPRNVVVILADDQAYDTLWAMPTVTSRLLPESVVFTRAYATVPMCCPARASFLSGGFYPRDTHMLTNEWPNGGSLVFRDADTLATRAQEAGVATALLGKYFNHYEEELTPYVPPGWSLFLSDLGGDGGYTQSLLRGSSGPRAGTEGVPVDTGGEFLSYHLVSEALSFVDAQAGAPFFVYLAPLAPHISSSIPATEDEGIYADFTPRPPSWNEEDVSDKPGFLQEQPPLSAEQIDRYDADAREMMESLTSLDRAVGLLLDGLDARGLLDETVIVYTSDNGYLNGEHRLVQKGLPYEEAVHVPLIVRAPGVAPREDDRLVAMNTDLAATVSALLGLPEMGEGRSLLPALEDPSLPGRDHLFLDNYTPGWPVWAGVVTARYKYVEWSTGDVELYDRVADPYELTSLHAAPPPDADIATWSATIAANRALAVTTRTIPGATVGVPYEQRLARWGGTDPVTWALDSGRLPPGLALSADGVLSGVPTQSGAYVIGVAVTDSGASPWTGEPQVFRYGFVLEVGGVGAFAPVTSAVVARGPASARILVAAPPGASVVVRVGPDATFDGKLWTSQPVTVGANGKALTTVEGLWRDRPLYWQARVDGAPGPSGWIPAFEGE